MWSAEATPPLCKAEALLPHSKAYGRVTLAALSFADSRFFSARTRSESDACGTAATFSDAVIPAFSAGRVQTPSLHSSPSPKP